MKIRNRAIKDQLKDQKRYDTRWRVKNLIKFTEEYKIN